MIITSKLPGMRLKFEFTPKILGTQRREKLTKWEERPYMLRFSITCPEVIPVICQLSRIQTFRSPEIWKSLLPWLALRHNCHIRFHDSPNNKPHTHEMEQFASKKDHSQKETFGNEDSTARIGSSLRFSGCIESRLSLLFFYHATFMLTIISFFLLSLFPFLASRVPKMTFSAH